MDRFTQHMLIFASWRGIRRDAEWRADALPTQHCPIFRSPIHQRICRMDSGKCEHATGWFNGRLHESLESFHHKRALHPRQTHLAAGQILHTHTHTLSLSLTHTHTRSHSLTHSLSLSLFLSLYVICTSSDGYIQLGLKWQLVSRNCHFSDALLCFYSAGART